MAYDANYSSVVLLLHGDGANGSTVVTDSSLTPLALTATGNASISAAQSMFGGSSWYFDGTGDYLSAATNAAFGFGTSDFTVEAFVYVAGGAGTDRTITSFQASSGSDVGTFFIDSTSGKLAFWYGSLIGGTGTVITTGAFHHVALSRASGVFRCYLDGVLDWSATATVDFTSSRTIGVGANTASGLVGTSPFNGYIDDLRITKGIARYTADFTPPAAPFPNTDHETASASLTGPHPSAIAYGGASCALTSPSQLFYAGVINSATASMTAPRSAAMAYSGAQAPSLTTPSPTLRSTGHDATGEQAAFLTSPSPLLTITTGADARATSPGPRLSASGTVTIWVKADLTAPVSTLAATGTVSGTAKVGLSAPSPNLVGYSGAVCSVTLTGSPTLTSTGTTGGVGGAQVTCPLFQLSASATAQNRGSANLLSPSPRLGAQAQAWLTAPNARLTAIGTAVITATYEAYAVNLKHTPRPGVEPIDETTRYTNFPFTHVVRHQNSYYGANSTGLYLLEGTTDDGVAIPFALKTAMSDFKSPTKKTLASAYFSGRFGPASSVLVHAGEKTPDTYAYSTPRDTLVKNHRQSFGRGLKARYFALGLAGSDVLELDGIEIDVHNLSRRI